MAWLHREKAPLRKSESKAETPDGLWQRCTSCQEVLFSEDVRNALRVCPNCNHHFPLTPSERIASLLDEGEFVEHDANLTSNDPLRFVDSKPYVDRLGDLYRKTGNRDAFSAVSGSIGGVPVELGVFDFNFMGGSMGCVVGEKISRLFARATERSTAAVIVTASGGARMQEGILSLMQMAKTCTALGHFKDVGKPFISVLTNPTTGGVAASFAMLGDVNIAEPGALIGFAGPRVIQQTLRTSLPPGFQTAEFLLQHGMIDQICHREQLRPTIARLLRMLSPSDAITTRYAN